MNILWLRARVPAVLTAALLLGFLSAAILARDWPDKARLFPWIVSFPAIGMLTIQLISDLMGPRGNSDKAELGSVMDLPADKDMPLAVLLRRAGVTFGWIIGLFLAINLVGFLFAVPGYVFFYMFLQAKEKWWISAIPTLVIFSLEAILFHYIMTVPWTEPAIGKPQEILLGWLDKLY